MPFQSKRQQRAAFAGAIPGISKAKAKEWADETDFDLLPEKAASRRVAKQVLDVLKQPGSVKNYADAVQSERDHRRRKKAAFDGMSEALLKTSFALPKPGAVFGKTKAVSMSNQVGKYQGSSTANFLKPPGPAASTQAIQPGRSLNSAMNVFRT